MRADNGKRMKILASPSLEGVGRFFLSFLLLTVALPALALDSAEVLPRGVNSPALRFGNISGISDNYSTGGGLISLHDSKSIDLDQAYMIKQNPAAASLPFGNLSMGTIHIDSQPNIQYTAIVHAWGISDRWTLGFGLPALHYTNKVSAWHEKGNIGQARAASGGMPAVQAQLAELERLDVMSKFGSELSSKGYRLESKDETLWGDLQIVSMLQLLKKGLATVTHKLIVGLPTGKRADPSDLAALDLFGRTSVENQLVGAYKFARNWSLNARGGLTLFLPDRVEKRVPLNDDDVLPDQAGQEYVSRGWNSGGSVAGSLNYDFTSAFSAGAGWELAMKGTEKYSGSSSNRSYESLARNTDTQAQLARLGLSYSTVGAYKAKRSGIPLIASLDLTDTFAGRNTPRQTTSEFSLTLFY